VTDDVLTTRTLNRTLLVRQKLLERDEGPVLDLVEHLVGLQAQEPFDPYLALWSRVAGFAPAQLADLLVDRKVVRIVVMRGTIHLVTADDALLLPPLIQPVLDKELRAHQEFAPALRDVDLEVVLPVGRALLEEHPRTPRQLRAALADAFPDEHAGALAYACRNHLAVVQVPPRAVWGHRAGVTLTTAEVWLGRPMAATPSLDEVVLRYLRAFGPATVADVAAWSRLTGMRAVIDRLRPRVRTFRNERGQELYDDPAAPIADADLPAPVRFLPEYDNVLLSHADRTRIIDEDRRRTLAAGERKVQGSVLVDGFGRATWRTERNDDGAVTLTIDHAGRLSKRHTSSIAAEGRRALRLLEPDASAVDVRFVALDGD
jgi:hypothetical protein